MSEHMTDADRETAEDLTRELWLMTADTDVVAVHGEQAAVHAVMDAHADRIAAALAAEREKARAPFLALADEMEKKSDELWQAYKRGSLDDPRRGSDRVGGQIDTLDGVIDRIRRAAEEGQQ